MSEEELIWHIAALEKWAEANPRRVLTLVLGESGPEENAVKTFLRGRTDRIAVAFIHAHLRAPGFAETMDVVGRVLRDPAAALLAVGTARNDDEKDARKFLADLAEATSGDD